VLFVRATIFNRKTPICTMESMIQKSETDLGTAEIQLPKPCVVYGAHENEDGVTTKNDETYWLTVYPDFETGSKNYFYWAFALTKNGHEFQFRDRQDVLKKGCKGWTDGKDCINSGLDYHDLCFTVSGTSRDITDAELPDLVTQRFPTSAQGGGFGGIVGEDGGELMGSTSNDAYKDAYGQLSDATSTQVVKEEDKMTTTITIESNVDGTPTWVIPVAVVLGVLATVLVVTLIVVFEKRRNSSQMETF